MGFFSKLKAFVMKSTATKLATAAIAVVLLGGSVAGIVYANVVNSPETVVARAFLNTFTRAESAMEEVFGLMALTENLKTQGTELGVTASVEEVPLNLGIVDLTLPNAGAGFVVRTNTAKESTLDVEVKVANTALLSGNLYFDEAQLQLMVPKLSKTVFAVKHGSETFKEDVKNSYLIEYTGISEEVLDEILDYVPEEKKKPDVQEIQKKLLEIFISGLKENFGEIELGKAGKTELTVDEEVLECKAYSTTIFRGNVSDFLYEVTFQTKNYIKELAAEYNITEVEVDYVFQNVDKVVQSVRNSITDVNVTFYVKEDCLVSVQADWGMEFVLGEPEEGYLDVILATNGNPLENMKMNLGLPVHQEESTPETPQRIDMDYERTTVNTEDGYAMDVQVLCNNNPFALSLDYEKLSGEFVIAVKDAAQSLELNGMINELEKGKKISLEAEKYTYTEGDYTEEQDLNISLYVKTLEGTVAPLSEEPVDVLKLIKEDVEALEEEIMGNVYKLAFSLMGLMQ